MAVAKVKAASNKTTKKEIDDGIDTKNSRPENEADSQKEIVNKTSKPKKASTKAPISTDKDQVVAPVSQKVEDTVDTVAKAGRRSAKAIAEDEAKKAKQERKAKSEETENQKLSVVVKPARARVERRSKNYRKSAELIDKTKQYSLSDALELAKKTSTVKFDASLELHIRLNVDPKQADQNVRDNVILPAGTGKTLRIAVFADADNVAKAKQAGADIAAGDEFLQQLDKAEINFDTLIATPQMMAKLGKYARLLGPKGLMPNPKSGTVTTDVVKAVTEAKAGRVEYRVDSTGIVHVPFGKISFEIDSLTQNAGVLLASIKAAKPNGIKGNYITSIFVTSTMGPSIRLAVTELDKI